MFFPCGSVPLVRALQTLRGTTSAHKESSYLYISALNLITRIMALSRDLAPPPPLSVARLGFD